MDTFSRNSSEQEHDDDDDIIEIDDHGGDDQEESGWTTYLDDFSNQNRTSHHQDKSSCSLLTNVSPSLVSDAATDAFSGKSFPVDFPAKLKFGRARTKKICEDDSLEDTASSPVNSPKVNEFEHIQTPLRKNDDYVSSSFVMGNNRGMRNHQIQNKESDEQKMTMMRNLREGNNNKNNMDLRSRGLCVVPISMLANF